MTSIISVSDDKHPVVHLNASHTSGLKVDLQTRGVTLHSMSPFLTLRQRVKFAFVFVDLIIVSYEC